MRRILLGRLRVSLGLWAHLASLYYREFFNTLNHEPHFSQVFVHCTWQPPRRNTGLAEPTDRHTHQILLTGFWGPAG
jgi:hypothetical protein